MKTKRAHKTRKRVVGLYDGAMDIMTHTPTYVWTLQCGHEIIRRYKPTCEHVNQCVTCERKRDHSVVREDASDKQRE